MASTGLHLSNAAVPAPVVAPAAAPTWGNSAGNWGGNLTVVHAGGYLGLVAAALAAYLSCAEVCGATCKRSVLPVFSLAQH